MESAEVRRMRISKVGGLIAAASKAAAAPLLRVGTIPVVRRIVLTYQQAGVFPIVVITGAQADEVKYELSGSGVVFLHNEAFEAPELFDSVRMGLSFLRGKCDRVLFTPVNVPMFTSETLRRLMEVRGRIVTPSYRGKGGHPVLLSDDILPDILRYRGPEGLRGVIHALSGERRRVEVDDAGILHTVRDAQQLQKHLSEHNRALLRPYVRLSIEKEALLFDSRMKLLLFLIADAGSVKSACAQMALSDSKAWNLLNALEKELGYPVVTRRQGGHGGGRTDLTERGRALLHAYQRFEETVLAFSRQAFDRLFLHGRVLERDAQEGKFS